MAEPYRINTTRSSSTEEELKSRHIPIVQRDEDTGVGESVSDEILDTAVSDISIENRLNAQRMRRFRADFSARFLQILRDQDFEYGVDTPADQMLRDCLKENDSITKQWVNELFVQNYPNHAVVIGILRVISHFEYHEVAPQGPTMALAALANSSAEVRECGIRAFENWNTMESLRVLKNVQCAETWLNDYLLQVIADLEEEFEKNVISG